MGNKAKSLVNGTKLDNGRYTIQANLCPGIDCLTYLANDGYSVIKEFCPEGASRNDDGSLNGCEDTNEFRKLANLHRHITSGIIGINSLGTYDMFEENNTVYFVYDFSGNGEKADFISYKEYSRRDYGKAFFHNSYDEYVKANRERMTLYDVIYPIWLAAHILYEYHENGYVHVNLKPEKILVSTDESNKPVAVQVLETGSAVKKENNDGRLVVTKGWSDCELTSGLDDSVDDRCDIYSLGKILFKTAVKTAYDICGDVEYEVTFHSSFPFEESECNCIAFADEEIKGKLGNVFEHSMRAYRGSRYDTALQFADALADIIMGLPETDFEAFAEVEKNMQEWHYLMRKE